MAPGPAPLGKVATRALQGREGTRPPGDGWTGQGGTAPLPLLPARPRPHPSSPRDPAPTLLPSTTTTPRTGGQQGSVGQPLASGVSTQEMLHGRPAGLGSPQATQRGAHQRGTGRPLLSPERPHPTPGPPAWPEGHQDRLQDPCSAENPTGTTPTPQTPSPLSPRPPAAPSGTGITTHPLLPSGLRIAAQTSFSCVVFFFITECLSHRSGVPSVSTRLSPLPSVALVLGAVPWAA